MSSLTSSATTIAHVKATYTNSNASKIASTAPFTFSAPLPLPHPSAFNPGSDTDFAIRKATYLSGLREAASALQDRMNSELTARMGEEAHEAAASNPSSSGTADGNVKKGNANAGEVAEEENYGEEMCGDEGE
ncbi:hypothetical protein GGR54DRAFT_644990 [Hypoxylon sp. NC1633]|nr:hypothetical protein GGR54DRAFT_644990 [Hypoxylon sp. NC1633]